ncbi:MAG: hypothetical protein HGA36_03285 [Candidatus Moranbacteria bacterium]|nr:hypothetical protein [Candidatus Moranbacteria bacterium]
MDKRIKIMLVVVLILAAISGTFLLFARKKPITQAPKTVAASAPVKTLTPAQTAVPSTTAAPTTPTQGEGLPQTAPPAVGAAKTVTPVAEKVAAPDRKILTSSEWSQCKAKTLAASTNLMWSVQITEGIPTGGTYAKGNLNGDAAFPVRITIKSDSTIIDKIKAMLVVGKTAFLRGNCTGVETDGAVMLQAF